MCLGTSEGIEHCATIHLDEIHPSIRPRYSRSISVDRCIGEELRQLLASGIATKGHSCCGHDRTHSHAYIHPDMVEKAVELNYPVVLVQDEMWENERIEYAVLLHSGTTHIPYACGVPIHQNKESAF